MRRSSLLLATLALASLPATVAQSEPVQIGGEWAPKPKPTPKRGKPTKAEKKAAKRARTRGVTAAPAIDYREWKRRYAARLMHHGWNERAAIKEAEYVWTAMEGVEVITTPEYAADQATADARAEDAPDNRTRPLTDPSQSWTPEHCKAYPRRAAEEIEYLRGQLAALGVGGPLAIKFMPGAIFAWNCLESTAAKIDNEEARNTVREFLMRAWHYEVLPAVNAADGVKGGQGG